MLKLSRSESLTVTLFVAVTNFIRLPIGGAISDRIGRRPLSILAFVAACPMSWFVLAHSLATATA